MQKSNPLYHLYAITTEEGKKNTIQTPAQQLGITDKAFELKDIIYLR